MAGKTKDQLTVTDFNAMRDEALANKKKEKEATYNTMGEGMDIQGLAQSVAAGELSPTQIANTRGMPLKALVQTEVRKQFPKFNFTLAESNYRWANNSANLRTISMIKGSLPRLQRLEDQIAKMPNGDFPISNAFLKQMYTQTGDPAYTDFESNRNAIVQEINTALSNSSQGSDYRVKIEMDNLNASRSPRQLKAAINNLHAALTARLDPSMTPPYPIEVVRGEKTLPQFIKEQEDQFSLKSATTPTGNAKKPFSEMTNAELMQHLKGK